MSHGRKCDEEGKARSRRERERERERRENINSRGAVLCGEGQENAIKEVVFERRTDANVRQEVMLLRGEDSVEERGRYTRP